MAHNAPLTQIERIVLARSAGAVGVARMLRCPPDAPLLVYETTLWMGARPVSWAQFSMSPDFQMDISDCECGAPLPAPPQR